MQGGGPLTDDNGFPDQGAVLVRSRQASDLLGATKMDRPEWIAIDQDARTLYGTLTNNTRRGMPGRPDVDAANPRDDNLEVPNLHKDPADPRRYSNWLDFRPDGRSRSATVAIRKADGGVVGT